MSNWETSEAEEYYSPQEELDFLSSSDQEENDRYDVQKPIVNGVRHQADDVVERKKFNHSFSIENGSFNVEDLNQISDGKHR